MHDWHLAQGYRFAAVHAGLRPDSERKDLAIIVSDRPASVAGVFTQNRVAAAPVQVCRERVPSSEARGVVICSGNANACTGARGLADARRMTELAAEMAGCSPRQMLVCSTGVIGRPLPMPAIESGIRNAASLFRADVEGFAAVAQAILTTDTRIKVSTRSIRLAGRDTRITGFAKGAAMIGPNMATMLAFVLTDAAVSANDLTQIARDAAAETFNCVRVEGHTSTNDTLLLFANGTGANLTGDELHSFQKVVTEVCADLARSIAADAEGASHLITIDVEGLHDVEEARRIARAVADSPLVKTAIFGADPNWGRIVSAAGYAGVNFDEKELSFWLGDMELYREGTPLNFDAAAASAYLKTNREIPLRLVFGLGAAGCRFWTSDLTYEYVRLNAEYTT